MDFRVAVGIVIRQNRVLLVQRTLKEGLLNWQFPAGKLEKGEDPMNTVEREVYEETGVICKAKELLGSRIHPLNKILIYYIICDYIKGEGTVKNTREVKSIKWVNPSDLMAYIPDNMYPGIKKYFEIDS